jgi:hypothetical protein
MTAITPPHPDSGTQPAPHYCSASRRPDGTAQGCPEWPMCVFPSPQPAGSPHDTASAGSTLGRDLAALFGFAAGAVLLLIVAAILLPVFL